MPETDFDLAERVAERCRNALETTPVAIGDHTLRVTTSAGLASFREQDSLKSLIARADAALFSAKAAGRNRVAIAAKDSFGADSKTDVSGD
ncbi:GGDEF domain-containing protein [Nisaea nitritireducens]|nr:diguanylate cyclase [Nisaea nitritireducens]